MNCIELELHCVIVFPNIEDTYYFRNDKDVFEIYANYHLPLSVSDYSFSYGHWNGIKLNFYHHR